MEKIVDRTVQSYMAALAAKRSTPGGGAAAAVSASQGLALLCMALNFTVGRKRYRVHDDTLRPILVQCTELWQEALCWADRDTTVFDEVMACYALPKATDAEREARSQRLETALYAAAEVPHSLLYSCRTALQDASVVGTLGNSTVLTDVIVGVRLLQAAAYGCEIHIRINLKFVKPTPRRVKFLESVHSLLQDVETTSRAALEACQSRLDLPT